MMYDIHFCKLQLSIYFNSGKFSQKKIKMAAKHLSQAWTPVEKGGKIDQW